MFYIWFLHSIVKLFLSLIIKTKRSIFIIIIIIIITAIIITVLPVTVTMWSLLLMLF